MRIYEIQEDFYWYNKWDIISFNDWQIPMVVIPITNWDRELSKVFKDVSKDTICTYTRIDT